MPNANENETSVETKLPPKLKFVNPYNLPSIEVQQIVADIGVNDYNFIKCIRPKNGTLTGVVCILWKKLVEECRARGITDFNQTDEFEQFVLTCKLVPESEAKERKEKVKKGVK